MYGAGSRGAMGAHALQMFYRGGTGPELLIVHYSALAHCNQSMKEEGTFCEANVSICPYVV